MSKKHYSKHCHIAVEAWDNGVPLYRVNVGNMEHGRFSFGLPLAYPLCSEERAIQWMTDIDEYIDAYIDSVHSFDVIAYRQQVDALSDNK